MSAPFDGSEFPTALGSIFGYRYWYLVGGELVSVSAQSATDLSKRAAWLDGENLAICNKQLSRHDLYNEPQAPRKPPLLGESDAPVTDFFGYARRAQLSNSRAWSYPTTRSGEFVLPQFGHGGAAADRVREEAVELYQERLEAYEREHQLWVAHRQKVMAEIAQTHPVPVLGCTCGFYMVKDHHFARNQYTAANPEHSLILGVVEGYGKVVKGAKGWRFEKARIRGLVCSIEFIRNHVKFELDNKNYRINLQRPTIQAFNNFRTRYSEPEFYDNEKDFFAEWDEKVQQS